MSYTIIKKKKIYAQLKDAERDLKNDFKKQKLPF
jgi:hypothetical protein